MKPHLAVLALVGAGAVSCKHDAPPAPLQPVVEDPVPAPDTLTAEGTLRDPDAFWGRVRSGGGPLMANAPDSAAGLLLGLAGVDRRLGALVSGSDPFQVALGSTPTGVAFAVAMKIRDLDAARTSLSDSENAAYTTEDVAGMVHLVPKARGASGVAVAFTASGYLVVASTVDALGSLGAYAARTMPTKPAVKSSFELRATPTALGRAKSLAPGFAATMTGTIAAATRNVLPPEVDAGAVSSCFAPPFVALATAASDLSEARVDVDADEGEVHAVAAFVPRPGDNAARKRLAAMHPVDAAPLLDAPRDAFASVVWGDTAGDRAEDATTIGACVGKALAPMLGGAGQPQLADMLSAWARGRGDWESVSLLAMGSVAGGLARAPVASAGDVSRTFQSAAALAAQPSVQDVIRRLLPLRAGGVETADIPQVGKAQVLMFAPAVLPSHGDDGGTATSTMSPPGMAWIADAKEVHVGVGFLPKELLGLVHPPAALGADPLSARAVKALGADASLAAIVRPPGCCAGGHAGSGPLAIGWGRKGDGGWATVSVGDELLGMLVARAAR